MIPTERTISCMGMTTVSALISNLSQDSHMVMVCTLCEKAIALLGQEAKMEVILDPRYLVERYVITKTFCGSCKIEIVDPSPTTNRQLVSSLNYASLPDWLRHHFGVAFSNSNTIVVVSPSTYKAVSECEKQIKIYDVGEGTDGVLFLSCNPTGVPFGYRPQVTFEAPDTSKWAFA